MGWLYVPGLPASNSGSPPSCPTIAPSVLWRGKPTRLQPSRGAWRTVVSSPLRSTVTCDPSTAQSGVDSWISSLRATRASLSPRPASALARTILDTCGPMFAASSPKQGLLWSAAKTSPLICRWDSTWSPRTWLAWATELRRECSRRRLSGRPTNGTGCSGSVLPTPTASQYGSSQNEGQVPHDRPSRGTMGLEMRAKRGLLPTPTAMDSANARNATANRTEGSKHHDGTTLCDWVAMLPTPTASTYGTQRGPKASPASEKQRDGQELTGSLETQARGTGGKLHPPFVEWMMGWPIGWTACEPVAMASFRLWQRGLLLLCCES